jgi:hypothetical protein
VIRTGDHAPNYRDHENSSVTEACGVLGHPAELPPDLAEAFTDGYGEPPSDTDRVIIHGCAAITSIWLTIKARETSQPSFEQASRAALTRLLAQG